jgi:outer membrane lipoprotein LolB
MHTLRWLVVCFCSIILTSCATLTSQRQQAPAVQAPSPSWEKHVQTVSDIKTWDLKAQIAIRQEPKAWSASLQWQQQQQNYHIALFGPLGTHAYELTGQPGKVQLAGANGKTFTASTPEQLLLEQSGSELPVSNLYYWIRGIPVPNMPAQKQFDASNRLISLQQQGWTIHYLGYTTVNSIDVPDKVFLNNQQLSVKIAINQWHF